jgi:integrase
MPRARTGTLVPPGADGFWRARVTKDHADGTTTRPLYSLGTTDKSLARRKLARLNALIAAGHDPLDAVETANAPERVKDYAEAWLEKRQAQGITSVKDERGWLTRHVYDTIGTLSVCDVRPSHVRGILDDALAGGLRRNSLANLRGVMHRLFRGALEAESIENNPVAAVRVPKTREVRKERAILTDAEFASFIASPLATLELRMLALVARCEGGMRAGDLMRWDWSMIDRLHFAECIIPRAKTRTPQALAVPDGLAPFLRAWWERAGKPESGPVFPARRGKRAGGFRATRGPGFAQQFRRDLFRAGVVRMPPVEVATDEGGTRTEPNPRDPLYNETATTLPVDFHSFRRAFNTALAEAGVNVQHAMHLASHSDPKVHARYVMSTKAMRTVPATALPRLPTRGLPELPRAPRIVTGRDESKRAALKSSKIPEVRMGFEPTYDGFANRCLTTWLPHQTLVFQGFSTVEDPSREALGLMCIPSGP